MLILFVHVCICMGAVCTCVRVHDCECVHVCMRTYLIVIVLPFGGLKHYQRVCRKSDRNGSLLFLHFKMLYVASSFHTTPMFNMLHSHLNLVRAGTFLEACKCS
jgi:hypothetical protein